MHVPVAKLLAWIGCRWERCQTRCESAGCACAHDTGLAHIGRCDKRRVWSFELSLHAVSARRSQNAIYRPESWSINRNMSIEKNARINRCLESARLSRQLFGSFILGLSR